MLIASTKILEHEGEHPVIQFSWVSLTRVNLTYLVDEFFSTLFFIRTNEIGP